MADRPRGRRGVLFDVDGTLVDSTFVHTLCWWQAFRQSDRDIPMASIHRAVGMGSGELTRHLVPGIAESDIAALAASHDALYCGYWPRLRALPGARELVRSCHQAGRITVLASSASEPELHALLAVLDIDEAIGHTTNSGEAGAGKPAPDLIVAALDKAGLSPDEAIFIGDSVWDVQACQAAGLDCIGLECGGTSAAELKQAGAVATFKHPADLLAHGKEQLT
ncbi:MAG TPA: HAD family hydrolase [Jatrophihabitans sp.]|nr:HAD family hydrolase [Jatrophihabitans sp.]